MTDEQCKKNVYTISEASDETGLSEKTIFLMEELQPDINFLPGSQHLLIDMGMLNYYFLNMQEVNQ